MRLPMTPKRAGVPLNVIANDTGRWGPAQYDCQSHKGVLCTAKKRGGGGESARFQHSARCASKWRRPNLREAGRTTGNPMLCYAGERLAVAFCVF